MGVESAWEAEGSALVAAVRLISHRELELPTRCAPWNVRMLTAHVIRGAERACEILESAGTGVADHDRLVYYRSPLRDDPGRDVRRHQSSAATAARFRNAEQMSDALATALGAAHHGLVRLGEDTVVTTHWGPAMHLGDYVRTRIVEIAVHGLDLADALGRATWLQNEAATEVSALLTELSSAPVATNTTWTTEDFIRVATGRRRLTPQEQLAHEPNVMFPLIS